MILLPSILGLCYLLASDALSAARRRLTLTWAALACAVGSRGTEVHETFVYGGDMPEGFDVPDVSEPHGDVTVWPDAVPWWEARGYRVVRRFEDAAGQGVEMTDAPPVPPDDALPDGREPPWGAEPAPAEMAVHDPAALDAGELALFPEPRRSEDVALCLVGIDPSRARCGRVLRLGRYTAAGSVFARAGLARCPACVAAMAGRSSS